MGSYDGAEICELVGLFILNYLGKSFGKENIGLYRNDGLAIIKNKSARLADKTRKELHKAVEQFGLKITAESNLHVVNFLDVTFDLSTGKYKPYRKPNDDPLYINKHSNHPPSILRQLPTSINKRISTLSSDKQTFEDAAPAYQNALGHSNFSHKLEYIFINVSQIEICFLLSFRLGTSSLFQNSKEGSKHQVESSIKTYFNPENIYKY